MVFGQFNQNDLELSKYDRPEDELDTKEGATLSKRERAFSAEGGFQNLLRLKLVQEDLSDIGGFLHGGVVPNYIQHVIEDPKKYAYSSLGFELPTREIPDNELQTALVKYLEECKRNVVAKIDQYLVIIIKYETETKSQALHSFKYTLEECKKLAQAGDWKSYGEKEIKAKSYFEGMNDLVELCCGTAIESEDTRRVLSAK